jgi:DNA end-binding protein Ku
MRPYWKGYLKLALVSCPIALHAACSSAERIAFRQINKATGNRLRQQLIDEETREPVAPEHKGRGYEVAKGKYLIVEDAELEAIEIATTHTIEIDRFVPRSAIDQHFFDSPYYVMPSEPVGQDAFAVIREAMRDKGMVALGRLVLSKRERVMALEPYDKGLLGTTLRYPYEVRKAEDYFCDLPGPLRGGTAGASEGQAGRRHSRAQEDLCSAAAGDQSHGGIAPQHRRGHERRAARKEASATRARKRA